MINVIHDIDIEWPCTEPAASSDHPFPQPCTTVDRVEGIESVAINDNDDDDDDDNEIVFAASSKQTHSSSNNVTKKPPPTAQSGGGGFPLGTSNWAAAALFAARPTDYKPARYGSSRGFSFPKNYYRHTHPTRTEGGGQVGVPYCHHVHSLQRCRRENITGVFEANGMVQRTREQAPFGLSVSTMKRLGLDTPAPAVSARSASPPPATKTATKPQPMGTAAQTVPLSESGVTHPDPPKISIAERVRAQQNRTVNDPDTTNAFMVHDLLSPAECKRVRRAAEPLLASLEAQYAQKHRKASRAMFRCPALTRRLYERLLPHLCAETDYRDRIPLCFGQDGVWVPFGLNECLKVFAYEPGGEFVPHRDGPWVPREDQCSMYTVVVYLNEVMRGGETMLLGTAPLCAPQGSRVMGMSANMQGGATQIPPSTGSALIFNHDCWHAGLPVLEGRKLILRTELIFQRVQSFYVDRHAFCSDAEYQRTRALYDASQQALKEGRREEFFEQYQTVVALQQAASQRASSRRAAKGIAVFERAGPDVTALIVEFLGVSSQGGVVCGGSHGPPVFALPALLVANTRTFAAIATCPLWERLLRERHCAALYAATTTTTTTTTDGDLHSKNRESSVSTPAAASSSAFAMVLTAGIRQWTRHLVTDAYTDHPQLQQPPAKSPAPQPPNPLPPLQPPPHQDHFSRFRQQQRLSKAFSPACLVLRPAGGSVLVTHPSTAAKPDVLKYIDSGHGHLGQRLAKLVLSSTLDSQDLVSALARGGNTNKDIVDQNDDAASGGGPLATVGYDSYLLPAYYGDWCYAYPLHMNQPNAERFCLYADHATTDESIRTSVAPIIQTTNRLPATATAPTIHAGASTASKGAPPRSSVQVDWSVLSVPVEGWIEPTAAPLLLCPPPQAWTNPQALRQHVAEAQEGIFGLLRAPAVAILHPATCAVLGHLSATGSTAFSSSSTNATSSTSSSSTYRLIDSVGIPFTGPPNLSTQANTTQRKPPKPVTDVQVMATPETIATSTQQLEQHKGGAVWGVIFVTRAHPGGRNSSSSDGGGSVTAFLVSMGGDDLLNRATATATHPVTAAGMEVKSSPPPVGGRKDGKGVGGDSQRGLAATPVGVFHRANLRTDAEAQSAVIEACNAVTSRITTVTEKTSNSHHSSPLLLFLSGILVVADEEDYRHPVQTFREALLKKDKEAASRSLATSPGVTLKRNRPPTASASSTTGSPPPPEATLATLVAAVEVLLPPASAFAASLQKTLHHNLVSGSRSERSLTPPTPPVFVYADNVMVRIGAGTTTSTASSPLPPAAAGGAPGPAAAAAAAAVVASAFGSACLMARGAALALHCCNFREVAVFRY